MEDLSAWLWDAYYEQFLQFCIDEDHQHTTPPPPHHADPT
jgi:hypothetical protein